MTIHIAFVLQLQATQELVRVAEEVGVRLGLEEAARWNLAGHTHSDIGGSAEDTQAWKERFEELQEQASKKDAEHAERMQRAEAEQAQLQSKVWY